jgi:hypothetical protein
LGIFAVASLFLGISALFLQTTGKLILAIFAFVVFVAVRVFLKFDPQREVREKKLFR